MIKNRLWNSFQKVILKIAGKKKYQVLFENLNHLSLIGMNISGGSDPENSGEKKTLEYVSQKLISEKELVLFDVGAHTGQYALLLKNTFNSKAIIHAFEPSAQTFKTLQVHLKNFNTIEVHNFGFGDQNIKQTLFSNEEVSGLASIYKRNLIHRKIDMNLHEEIELKIIDDFCTEKKIKQIHFLKLDVEGNELNVLKGASTMIRNNNILFIQFEFGGCNIDSRTYFRDFYYLLSEQYKIYRIVKDGLFEIKNYKESYEAFLTTNFLAEKK